MYTTCMWVKVVIKLVYTDNICSVHRVCALQSSSFEFLKYLKVDLLQNACPTSGYYVVQCVLERFITPINFQTIKFET